MIRKRTALALLIVFIVLSIYIAVACVRRGIWDRRFQMNAKQT